MIALAAFSQMFSHHEQNKNNNNKYDTKTNIDKAEKEEEEDQPIEILSYVALICLL